MKKRINVTGDAGGRTAGRVTATGNVDSGTRSQEGLEERAREKAESERKIAGSEAEAKAQYNYGSGVAHLKGRMDRAGVQHAGAVEPLSN